jgi:hypothetical protein
MLGCECDLNSERNKIREKDTFHLGSLFHIGFFSRFGGEE